MTMRWCSRSVILTNTKVWSELACLHLILWVESVSAREVEDGDSRTNPNKFHLTTDTSNLTQLDSIIHRTRSLTYSPVTNHLGYQMMPFFGTALPLHYHLVLHHTQYIAIILFLSVSNYGWGHQKDGNTINFIYIHYFLVRTLDFSLWFPFTYLELVLNK